MSRDTYSAREKAIRAEIERQAPDLKLKYVFELDHGNKVGVSFDFGGGPITCKALNADFNDPGMVAAQLIASARYLRSKFTVASDVTNWAAP